MKNIYGFYGEPKTGKSAFIYNSIYDKGKDLVLTSTEVSDETFDLYFVEKFTNNSRTYRNIIIDDFSITVADKRKFISKMIYNLDRYIDNFDNLIVSGKDLKDVKLLIENFAFAILADDIRLDRKNTIFYTKYLDFNN